MMFYSVGIHWVHLMDSAQAREDRDGVENEWKGKEYKIESIEDENRTYIWNRIKNRFEDR